MSRLVMDGTLGPKLRTVSETVELVDEAGRVLGVYTPVRLHVPPPGFQLPISDEELDKRNKVRAGRSLGDIMADLKAKHN